MAASDSPTPSTPTYSSAPSITTSGSMANSLSTKISSTLSSYLFESALNIQASPGRLPTSKRKTPLSLQQTTINFNNFVQKAGPLFYFQDAVEATLLWDDWSWTLMWMGIWAVIAIHPYLLLCVPSFVVAVILLKTHQARFPLSVASAPAPAGSSQTQGNVDDTVTTSGKEGTGAKPAPTPADALRHSVQHPSSIGEGSVRPPLVPQPPAEGSIPYLENLRDIQNMMKMVPDGYDAIVPVVPYLNWSSYNRSLLLLQLSILITVVMFFLGPHIPLRLVLLIGGEGAFIANHPWVEPIVQAIGRLRASSTGGKKGEQLQSVVRKRGKEMEHRLRGWLELDRLDDSVWEKGWRDVEIFENERFNVKGGASRGAKSGWVATNPQQGDRKPWTRGSDGWSPELEGTGYALDIRHVASSLEKGWAWVEGDDWRIDWAGEWSSVGVDDEGYVYTDADWQRPAPYAYGHEGQPEYPLLPPEVGKQSNERTRESEGRTFPVAALANNAKAQTRRRRWLRRCVRVA